MEAIWTAISLLPPKQPSQSLSKPAGRVFKLIGAKEYNTREFRSAGNPFREKLPDESI
jgi:hypothetical protein